VDGLSRSRVTSLNDINALLDRGDSVRATASTNANDTSSRSHAILTITLRKNNDVNSASSSSNNNNNITESNLVLVDLAGSERYNDISGSAYTRRAESRSINLSLSSLGNCIHALSEGKSHIPFRDSKLTRLLRASLGGGSRLSIIVTVPPGPDSNGDILNSLRFAARAAKVKVEAKVSRFVDYESLYREAQLQIDVFNSQENKQASEIRDLIIKIEAQDREILELKSQNNLLTAQNDAYQQNESKGGSSKTTMKTI
jgi:kinesin family protein 5